MHTFYIDGDGAYALNGVDTKKYVTPPAYITQNLQVVAVAAKVFHKACCQQACFRANSLLNVVGFHKPVFTFNKFYFYPFLLKVKPGVDICRELAFRQQDLIAFFPA